MCGRIRAGLATTPSLLAKPSLSSSLSTSLSLKSSTLQTKSSYLTSSTPLTSSTLTTSAQRTSLLSSEGAVFLLLFPFLFSSPPLCSAALGLGTPPADFIHLHGSPSHLLSQYVLEHRTAKRLHIRIDREPHSLVWFDMAIGLVTFLFLTIYFAGTTSTLGGRTLASASTTAPRMSD